MHTTETGIYIALLSGGTILALLICFFVITIVRYQRTKVAFHRSRIREEFNYLDKERQRLAYNLHDDFGSSLSNIKLRLQCMNNLDKENTAIIEKAESTIDDIMHKLRQFSFDLMPSVLQREGLTEALRELIDLIPASSGIKANCLCNANITDPDMEIHIYRITQEILNNIVKHAGATRVNLILFETTANIELKISDNGRGFKKEEKMIQMKGVGLHSITARTEILKAKLYLDTDEDQGTKYHLIIPKR